MKILNDIGIVMGISLMYAAPLIFTSLGGVISENAGVVNIGLEGDDDYRSFYGGCCSHIYPNPWLGLVAAGLAGGGWLFYMPSPV